MARGLNKAYHLPVQLAIGRHPRLIFGPTSGHRNGTRVANLELKQRGEPSPSNPAVAIPHIEREPVASPTRRRTSQMQ